jgi:hypothetical protein
MYALTSLAFLVAIILFKTELFAGEFSTVLHSPIADQSLGLDQLSHWLQSDKHYGQAVLFLLIFLTTIRK